MSNMSNTNSTTQDFAAGMTSWVGGPLVNDPSDDDSDNSNNGGQNDNTGDED